MICITILFAATILGVCAVLAGERISRAIRNHQTLLNIHFQEMLRRLND